MFKIKLTDGEISVPKNLLLKHSVFFAEAVNIDDDDDDKTINLTKEKNITVNTFNKIIEFLQYYDANPYPEISKPLRSNKISDHVPQWYASFLNDLNKQEIAKNYIPASNLLQIDKLLQLLCAFLAADFKGKDNDELKKTIKEYGYTEKQSVS